MRIGVRLPRLNLPPFLNLLSSGICAIIVNGYPKFEQQVTQDRESNELEKRTIRVGSVCFVDDDCFI